MIKELKIDPAKETQRVVDFIKEECDKAGITKAVVGISGGIDSAVIANITARALGQENVFLGRNKFLPG